MKIKVWSEMWVFVALVMVLMARESTIIKLRNSRRTIITSALTQSDLVSGSARVEKNNKVKLCSAPDITDRRANILIVIQKYFFIFRSPRPASRAKRKKKPSLCVDTRIFISLLWVAAASEIIFQLCNPLCVTNREEAPPRLFFKGESN